MMTTTTQPQLKVFDTSSYKKENKQIPKVKAWLRACGAEFKGTSAPRVGAKILLSKCSTLTRNALVSEIRRMDDYELLKYKGLGETGLAALRKLAEEPKKHSTRSEEHALQAEILDYIRLTLYRNEHALAHLTTMVEGLVNEKKKKKWF
jgi:hypothetical protein